VTLPPEIRTLRYHAEKVIELTLGLRDPDDPPAQSAESLVGQLVRQAHRRSLHVQASYGAVPVPAGLTPLQRLQTELPPGGARAAVLFTREAMTSPESAQWVLEVAAGVAAVRIYGAALPTMAIVDGRVALVAVDGGTQLAIVREPVAVQAMQTLHSAIWESATDLAEVCDVDMSWAEEPMTRRVLGMLGSGRTDEVAARELNLSVRTYRRHVAELMTRIHARSRFHAGLRVARLGLDHH
jgi:DNA-binding CsgD family transcriptional regulator